MANVIKKENIVEEVVNNELVEETNELVVEEVVTQSSTKKEKYVNPFDEGVTYDVFQKALGKKTVADYCKGKLTEEEINFLELELELYNNKNK